MSDNKTGEPKSTVLKTSENLGMTAAKNGPTTDLHSSNSKQNSEDSGAVAQDKDEVRNNRCLKSQEESRTTLKVLSENAGSLQGRLGMYMQYLCIG